MEPRYPDILVPLSELDSNVFSLIGATQKALRKGGVSDQEIQQFRNEAMSGDYDYAVKTIMRWVDTE